MKILLLACFILLSLLRFSNIKQCDRYLFFMLMMAFSGISFSPYSIAHPMDCSMGPFLCSISITFPLIFCIISFVSGKRIQLKKHIRLFLMLFFVFVINYINPYNVNYAASLPVILNVIPVFLFSLMIVENYDKRNIMYCLYEVCCTITIFELILVFCYPILKMDFVSTLFYGDLGFTSSLKRVGYVSAVGSYIHPAGLACVSALFALFFFALYREDYNKKKSLLFFVINIFVIYFTYSRTTFVVLLVSLLIVYLFSRRIKVSFKYIIYNFCAFIIIYILSFIPSINNLFFKSDTDEMLDSRMIHWVIGLDIFDKFPIMGCGINTHIYYMQFIYDGIIPEFIRTNPIHNIHIIFLAELGLIGLIWWLYVYVYIINRTYNYAIYGSYFKHIGGVLVLSMYTFMILYSFFGWSFLQAPIYSPLIVFLIICFNFKDR